MEKLNKTKKMVSSMIMEILDIFKTENTLWWVVLLVLLVGVIVVWFFMSNDERISKLEEKLVEYPTYNSLQRVQAASTMNSLKMMKNSLGTILADSTTNLSIESEKMIIALGKGIDEEIRKLNENEPGGTSDIDR